MSQLRKLNLSLAVNKLTEHDVLVLTALIHLDDTFSPLNEKLFKKRNTEQNWKTQQTKNEKQQKLFIWNYTKMFKNRIEYEWWETLFKRV
jgi:hypothetical protein